MGVITTKDGTEIFYKDWGGGQPIVFHHGWPLSADDWDSQMLFFLEQGYRVIAHDRRGHGRSTQTRDRERHGHVRRRRGGARRSSRSSGRDPCRPFDGRRRGRTLRRRYGKGRVAKAVLISAVPPIMVKSEPQPRRHADRGLRRIPRPRSPPAAPSSTSMSRAARSTGTTVRARRCPRAWSATGGVRA